MAEEYLLATGGTTRSLADYRQNSIKKENNVN